MTWPIIKDKHHFLYLTLTADTSHITWLGTGTHHGHKSHRNNDVCFWLNKHQCNPGQLINSQHSQLRWLSSHIMMTSSNGNIFRVTGPLCGEFTSPGEFPTQRSVTRSFDVLFDLCLNNGWVNNRQAGDLRRHRAHYDVIVIYLCLVIQICHISSCLFYLTHLPLDKMAAISQTIFSYAFLWIKSFVFWLKFHWSLFLGFELTIFQHWFR